MTDFDDVWRDALDEVAAGLDLSDPEDRAILRSRVGRLTSRVTLSGLNRILAMYLRPRRGSRAEAVRSIANVIIERTRLPR